jgi:hypothetical protein
MSRFAATLAPALTILVTASAAVAAPDTLCLPDVGANEPAWWNPGLSAIKKEARWAGALVRKHVAGFDSARLRALWSPASERVFVEVRVNGDTTLDPDHDALVVVLGDAAGLYPELLIRFAPLAGCGGGACAYPGAALDDTAVTFSEATVLSSISWSPLSPTTPSGDFSVEHPWIVTDASGWTLSFALHVPVNAAGDVRPHQRISANALAYEPGVSSGTFVEHPILCTSSSLTSNDCSMFPDFEAPDDLPVGNLEDSWSRLRSDCAQLSL